MAPDAALCARMTARSARNSFSIGDQGAETMKMNRSVARWLLLALILFSFSAASFGQIAVGISVRIGPPALPVYAQPICPGPGYFWTPGYWSWNDDDGYYWVPGTWVVAPVGMLWTPGYWGWNEGLYVWHGGYWGPHVGFYGGINYGYGYGGVGFGGGEWRGGGFYYNRSVTNVSVTNVTNVYNKTVIVNNTTVNNVSYNGGTGGVRAEPTQQERMAEHEQHTAPVAAQTQHEHLASQNKENFARVNQGKPAIAATAKAGDFSGRSAIPARAAGAAYHPPAMSPKEARGPAVAGNRPLTPANSNNANRPTGGTKPSPQDKSNQGFRPFTPPSKGGAANTAGGNQNHPTGSMPANSNGANRMTGSSSPSPQNKSNSGFRPFTPPSKGNAGSTAGTNQNHPNQSPVNQARPQNRATEAHQQNQPRPQNQPHTESASRPMPQPKPSAARPEPHKSSPPPPPKNQPEHHKGN